MNPKEKLSRDDFPDELREQFAVVERRLWKVETTMAVCLAAAGLFGSYLVLFFSDRLWDSPGWLRLGLPRGDSESRVRLLVGCLGCVMSANQS